MMIKVAIFFPIIAMGVYFFYAAFKYTRMISNIFLSLIYTPVLEPTLSSRGEKVAILDTRDEEIDTLLVESKGSNKVVIFCHESGAPKESWEKYAYFFPDFGWHVLSVGFEPPSSGEGKNSLSQWPTDEDVSRLLTVIRWTKKALSSDIHIVLFGVSKGADVAFAASFQDPSVKAIVADGLFSMKEIFRDYIRKWAPILVKPNLFGEHYPDWVVNVFTNLGFWFCQKKSGRRFVDVEELLARGHAPLLMVHGEKDDYIPKTHRDFLERINSDRKTNTCLVIPEARHNQSVVIGREIYERSIIDFLSGPL